MYVWIKCVRVGDMFTGGFNVNVLLLPGLNIEHIARE